MDVKCVETQHSAAHALGRGNPAERVKSVCLVNDVQRFALFRQNHHLTGALDLFDVAVGDFRALDLDAAAVRIDFYVLAGDHEKRVADVEGVVVLAAFLLDGLQDAFYRLRHLMNVENLTFANAGRIDFGMSDYFKS